MFPAPLTAVLIATLAAPDPGRFSDRTSLWQRSERNVLWGFRNMYQPHVVYQPGADYPLRMWFFGWASEDCNPGYPGCDAIYAGRAQDLDHWEVWAGEDRWDATMTPRLWVPVVAAQDKPWDQWHNGDPSVVLHDGVYQMVYSSTGFDLDGIQDGAPGDTDGDVLCIMGATSPDGIHWTRSERPILIYEHELGNPGNRGNQGAVDFGWYHRPSLLWDGDRWRLWFDYWAGVEREGTGMGLAECRGDFLNPDAWHVVRAGPDPLIRHWPNPDVVQVGSRYYSYADPYVYGNHPWAGRQIAEAVSDDGLTWRELGFIKPDSDTPADHVPEAFAMEEGGQTSMVLFYACQTGGEPYDYRYSRLRYMKRPLTGQPD